MQGQLPPQDVIQENSLFQADVEAMIAEAPWQSPTRQRSATFSEIVASELTIALSEQFAKVARLSVINRNLGAKMLQDAQQLARAASELSLSKKKEAESQAKETAATQEVVRLKKRLAESEHFTHPLTQWVFTLTISTFFQLALVFVEYTAPPWVTFAFKALSSAATCFLMLGMPPPQTYVLQQ